MTTRLAARSVAIVSGANSGLGAATASALLRCGAKVLFADLQESTVPSDDSSGGTPATAVMDVTNPADIEQALNHAEDIFGEPVNTVVNCAGIAVAQKTLSKRGVHDADAFAKVMRVNTLGSFYLASQAAERMAQREADEDGLRGCIIHTASIAAYEGQIGQVAYAASKGAIVGMTLPMARDLAPFGIRVMTIVRQGTSWCASMPLQMLLFPSLKVSNHYYILGTRIVLHSIIRRFARRRSERAWSLRAVPFSARSAGRVCATGG